MIENTPFTRLISFLKEVKLILSIFDVESIEQISYSTIEEFRQFKPIDFVLKKLPALIDDLPLLTSRDFYDDNEFNKVRTYLDELTGNESENNFLVESIEKYPVEAIKLYVLLLMFLCVGYMELNTGNSKTLQQFETNFKTNYGLPTRYQYFWYRGVTNIDDFDLVPSMYRSIKDPYVHIDDTYIDSLYKVNNLDREYKKIFKTFKREEFLAYMQHSIAYSPLIDFTNNVVIAGSFATQFTNAVDYVKKDSGLFLLVRDTRMNTRAFNTNIELFNECLTPFSNIFGKPLFLCSLSDFYVKYNVVLNKSNDRMKYQDGLFLNIYKAVFVKGKLLFPDSTTKLFIIRIPFGGSKITKDDVTNDISQNFQEYEYDYLMDPYNWFGKRHN